MKKFLRMIWGMILLGGLPPSVSAADQTWTGQISDSKCGDNHTQMTTERYKDLQLTSGAPAKDCTLACVKAGGKYVFVMNGKIYKIANQHFAALKEHASEFVRLTGDLQDDRILVSRIETSTEK
jgi:hypothetical protein